MSCNPRDMINTTHDALVHLGLVNDTPPAPPPSPVPLEDEDVVIIPPLPSPPGTPEHQIMPETPLRPPSVGRRELVQQRLDVEVAPEQLPRQLHFREVAETPGRLPVQRVANYPIQDLIRPLF